MRKKVSSPDAVTGTTTAKEICSADVILREIPESIRVVCMKRIEELEPHHREYATNFFAKLWRVCDEATNSVIDEVWMILTFGFKNGNELMRRIEDYIGSELGFHEVELYGGVETYALIEYQLKEKYGLRVRLG